MVLGDQWVVRKLLCKQLWLLGVCLSFFLFRGRECHHWSSCSCLPCPCLRGRALQRACRAAWGWCCLVDPGHVSSVCSLAAAVAPRPPLVSPAPHMAGQVAGGKSLPLLVTGVADAVWQDSGLVCSWNAGPASPNPSLSHRKVALIYLFCIWLFFLAQIYLQMPLRC